MKDFLRDMIPVALVGLSTGFICGVVLFAVIYISFE